MMATSRALLGVIGRTCTVMVERELDWWWLWWIVMVVVGG